MAEATQPSQAQIDELDALKELYGKSVKIIRNIGEFSSVVDVKIGEVDCSIKFQLEGSYPDEAPHIIVKSSKLVVEDKEELSLKLTSEATKLNGQAVIQKLVNRAKEWIAERGLDLSSGPDSPKQQRDTRQKKSKKQRKMKSEDEVLRNEKLPSMKTAMDVVSRIRWDDSVPQEHFRIGYIDRHLGLMERNFRAFSWEDISSVDYNTLAIPKHRIQYFKYKEVIVWEKTKRLDNVFGSTGSGITINDVIANYKDEAQKITSSAGAACDTDDGDDSDIEINLGDQESDEEHDEVEKKEELTKREQYWGKKNRPTHFLCLRVTNPEVKGTIGEVHPGITKINPDYHDCIIPTGRLHVTLACLGLDTEEQVQYAADMLHSFKSELESWNPSDIELKFNGAEHFYHSVVYSPVEYNKAFIDFAHHLRSCMLSAGIEIRDVFDFTPHMTIMKMKKRHGHELRSRYLDTTRIFDSMQGKTQFGSQRLDSVALCEMSEDRQPDGFYITPAEISFPFSSNAYQFKD